MMSPFSLIPKGKALKSLALNLSKITAFLVETAAVISISPNLALKALQRSR
jgi:hypothetical protein